MSALTCMLFLLTVCWLVLACEQPSSLSTQPVNDLSQLHLIASLEQYNVNENSVKMTFHLSQ